MKSYTFTRIILADIDTGLKMEIVSFVQKVSAHTPTGYLESRFEIYPELIIAYRNAEIQSVQFIHFFEHGEGIYCYLGPLFSSGKTFFELFTYWLNELHPGSYKHTIYLTAEFEHPGLFLFFKTIFRNSSFPHPAKKTPASIKHALGVFTQHIKHIHNLNEESLITTCNETIGMRPRDCEQKYQYLSIPGGHARLLIVVIPAAVLAHTIARLAYLKDNRNILEEQKMEVLDSFREGAVV